MPTFGIPCEQPDMQPCIDYLNLTLPIMNEVVTRTVTPILETIERNNTLLTEIIETILIPVKNHKKACTRRINAVVNELERRQRNNLKAMENYLQSVIQHLPPGTTIEEIPIPAEQGGGTAIQVNPPEGYSTAVGFPIGYNPAPVPPTESQEPLFNIDELLAQAHGGTVETGTVSDVSLLSNPKAAVTDTYPFYTGDIRQLTQAEKDIAYKRFLEWEKSQPEQIQAAQEQAAAVAAAKQRAESEQAVSVPPKPLNTFGFQCPQITVSNVPLHGIIGTAEWCADAEKVIAWLHAAGTVLSSWIRNAVDPAGWKAAVIEMMPAKTDDSIWGVIQRTFFTLLADVADLAGKGILLLMDLIRCAMTWAEFLTPIRDVPAYVALVVISNIINWVRDSRIGSQSYLGVTVSTALAIPQFETYLRRMMDYLCCVDIPTVAEIMEAHTVGTIGDKQYECLMRLNGADPRLYEPFYLARSDRVSAEEAIEYARRNGLSDADMAKLLHRAGWSDPKQAQVREALYDELPSIADHLHWLQRNVFNPDYVRDYRLLDGFEDRFWKAFGKDLYAQGYTKQRAEYEYAAHWIMPSPTQMLEFVYRLRPGRDKNGTTFTIDDYKRILAEQDYNVLAREWFAATAYRVPALSYLRDAHRMDLLTDKQMQEYHADLGYSESDSLLFVRIDTVRKRRMRATQGSGWNPAAIKKAFSVNQLTSKEVDDKMLFLGFSKEDSKDLQERAKADYQYSILVRARSRLLTSTISSVSQALEIGVIDVEEATSALQKIGWTETQAAGIANLENAKNSANRVKRIVRSIRRMYISGEVDKGFASIQLGKLAIKPDRITQYLTEWDLEQSPQRKRLTAQQIITEMSRGVLDPTEGKVRLKNLGYSDSDIGVKIADTEYATIQTEAALDYATTLSGRSKTKALAELGDKQFGLARTTAARLKQMEPPAKLVKWYKLGVKGVTCGYIRKRLRLYGWDNSSIDKWLEEQGCTPEEEEAEAGDQGGGEDMGGEAPPSSSNGTGVGEMP